MSEVASDGLADESQQDDALVALNEGVRTKRAAIEAYLAVASRRRDRLAYITIFGSVLAAGLMAGPAIFGKPFSDAIQSALGAEHPAWQLLCAVALVCSLTATTATQLSRSKGHDEDIARARTARGVLEALDVGIMCGYLTQSEATRQYLKCIEDLAFLDAGEAHDP